MACGVMLFVLIGKLGDRGSAFVTVLVDACGFVVHNVRVGVDLTVQMGQGIELLILVEWILARQALYL